jgi:penicillin-binding protein 2
VDGKGIYEDLSLVQGRAQRLVIVVEIVFVFLFLYYWKIQILDHGKYWRLSESNRVRETVLVAPRGLILDRKNVLIATNVGSFRVSLIRENSPDLDASYKAVGALLKLDEATLRQRVAKYASLPAFTPIVVQDNLSMEDVARVEARKLEFPELVLEAEPKRFYPFGSFASHVLGYLQELSEADVRSKAFPQRHLGDLVGKMGLESVYQTLLAGENGRQLETVDSLGRHMGEFERTEPRPSPGLKLTLDFDLQRKAEELLSGREGAVVVMDARTGGILALASFPTYEPNRFINRFSPEEWQGLIADPSHPLENRAIRGLYSPGSVFKVTMALAALDAGVIDDHTAFYCPGSAQIYGRTWNCWRASGHGTLVLDGAIQNSCDVFFYNVARRMDVDQIARYARMVGFGSRTGIDLPGEKDGLVPTTEWKRKTFKAPWFPGETISVGIGQGPLLATPLQVAATTAFIARRGIKVFPHLVSPDAPGYWRRWLDANGGAIPPITQLKRSDFERVVLGMYESVNKGGTGAAARVEGFDVCGKTGSTQTVGRERAQQMAVPPKTHSWFSGFGPRDNPEVVVTVLVEFGGMGGTTAAPVAGQLFALYQQLKAKDRSKADAR